MAIFFSDTPAGFSTTPIVNGPPVRTFPLRAENCYAQVFSQPFLAASGTDVVNATGQSGIFPNTYLVAESDRSPVAGDGIQAFTREYAEIPSGFNTWETTTYTFPALYIYRAQLSETVSVRVYHDFFLTNDPSTITLSGAQRYTNYYGWDITNLNIATGGIYVTNPTYATYSGWVTNGTEIVCAPATRSRYMGPIWRRSTPYVKAL